MPRNGRVHPYPKHLSAFDYLGLQRYFLTFCTEKRACLFIEAEAVAIVEFHFLRTAAELGFADLAHCFMPDHLHAAVEGRTSDANLKQFVARMKQYTGFYFKQRFKVGLWQRYSYERVIRSDQATNAVIRYVLENPLRAGLVSRIGDYKFIGSTEYTREQLLKICDEDLPPEGGSHEPRKPRR